MKAARRAKTMTSCALRPKLIEGAVADDGEADDEEGDEQPGVARADQGPNGERRPRRRGRRGGRRRRGNGAGRRSRRIDRRRTRTDAGSGSHRCGRRFRRRLARARAVAGASPNRLRSRRNRNGSPQNMLRPETVSSAPTPEETAQEADRAAARRRSTVREKVCFLTSAQPEAAPPSATARPSRSRPARPRSLPCRHSRAAPRKAGLVVAALRQRRVSSQASNPRKNRPAKPGGFFFGRELIVSRW